VGHAVGQGDRLGGRDADHVAVAAEACDGEYLFAHRAPGAVAYRGDVAGDLVADHGRQLRGIRIEPESRHDIGEVTSRRPYADLYLTRLRQRIRRFTQLEHLGRADTSDPNLAHRLPSESGP